MTIRQDRHGNVVQASRPFSSQSIAVGAGSVASTAFAVNKDRPLRNVEGQPGDGSVNHTRHIRCVATVACWIAFGAAPTAVVRGSGSMYLPAGLPEYFWVLPGEQIAVIQDSAAGFLYVSELFN